MVKLNIKMLTGLSIGLFAMGCSSSSLVVNAPLLSPQIAGSRVSDLEEEELSKWGHLDLEKDTVPGMSVDRAYSELLKKKKGKPVIVAVIDSGIDLDHEDLKDIIWVNSGEKPNDGTDNDQNGYIDDIHGYNFLGESYNEQMEMARILRLKLGDEAYQKEARTKLEAELAEAKETLPQIKQIERFVAMAHQSMQKALGKEFYSLADLENYQPKNQNEEQSIGILMQVMGMGEEIPSALKDLQEGVEYYESQVKYNLNVDFDGRKPVGDNPYDYSDQEYGNGNPDVREADESHGSHVTGIIAATRNNKKGIDGVAQNVKIMALRAVPNGDEYDKDVALAIRYAADNGAKVINGSFGKDFSPNAEWVYEALKYAAEKDVLFVNAAGNDGIDLDSPDSPNFPTDRPIGESQELVDNFLTVGALTYAYGPDMIASFSNYGKENVDIFAPGDEIYSTMPNNQYEYQGGTSMAAPAVAGLAAMIRSYFPELTATQVKKIIMESGVVPQTKVTVGGAEGEVKALSEISKSGKIANLYNALILASKVSKGELSL